MMDMDNFIAAVRGRRPGIMDARGEYAVLLLLVKRQGVYHLLYEVRSDKIDCQPGEVCFPGGAMEPGETPAQCALRETWEELGITSAYIDMVCRLDTFHPSCGLVIRPFVAVLDERAMERLAPNPDEVKEVFTVPLEDLTDPYVYTYPAVPLPGEGFPYEALGIGPDYPWRDIREELVLYQRQGNAICGFTALMTRSLVNLIAKTEEQHDIQNL